MIFKFGESKRLPSIWAATPTPPGLRKTDLQPQVSIFGSGKLTLSHIAVFRDIHYLDTSYRQDYEPAVARGEGNPIKLGKDEFFAMGDNSPSSSDSRYWDSEGVGNAGKRYRAGIVPRDYLVGKAMFVYWPSGFRLFSGDRWGLCPNIGAIRFIYGGKTAYSQ